MTNEDVLKEVEEECENRCIDKECSDCEAYFIKTALEKANKYRWHDLRKNPDDLPTNPLNSVIAWDTNHKRWLFAQYNGREWIVAGNGQTYYPNVIGWTEMLEPFEVKE